MPVTIKDISEYLGISVSSVSKALNGYPDVADDTRAAVVRACEELGYHPSATARSLRLRRTDRIGLVHPIKGFENDTYVAFFRGLAGAAQKRGYQLLLYTAQAGDPDALQRICRSREVDGMVLMGAGIAGVQEEAIHALQAEELPFVVLGNPVPAQGVPWVAADNRAGALAVVRHLLELGHRRIAYIGRPDDPENDAERFAGYRQALAEAGLELDEALLAWAPYLPYSGAEAMLTLLQHPDPPTAVFAFNDHIAVDASQAAVERGLRIPDDLAVAGFDDNAYARIATPAVTTARIPHREMGARSLELLLELMAGERPEEMQVVFPCELIVRPSTSSPAPAS